MAATRTNWNPLSRSIGSSKYDRVQIRAPAMSSRQAGGSSDSTPHRPRGPMDSRVTHAQAQQGTFPRRGWTTPAHHNPPRSPKPRHLWPRAAPGAVLCNLAACQPPPPCACAGGVRRRDLSHLSAPGHWRRYGRPPPVRSSVVYQCKSGSRAAARTLLPAALSGTPPAMAHAPSPPRPPSVGAIRFPHQAGVQSSTSKDAVLTSRGGRGEWCGMAALAAACC